MKQCEYEHNEMLRS